MNQDKKNAIVAWGIVIAWIVCLFGGGALLAVDECVPLQAAGAVFAFMALVAFVWFLNREG